MTGSKYTIKPSARHGVGAFALRNIGAQENVGVLLARLYFFGVFGGRRTDLGCAVNHAGNPNCKMVKVGRCWSLVATRCISAGEELTMSYDDTPWFVASASLLRRCGEAITD